MSMRMDKVNNELKRQIAQIVQAEVDDPSLGLLSITRVETSPDLRESRVYFSLLDETKVVRAKSILDKMAKFIRINLGKRIRLKILPELIFIADDSIRYSVHMYEKIEEARGADDKTPDQDQDGKGEKDA